VTLEEWLDAPAPPLKRWECEDPDALLELRDVETGTVELVPMRPCPALRCKYHLGKRGAMTCRLDFEKLPADERTYAVIGDAAGMHTQEAHRIVSRVAKRNQRDTGTEDDVPDEQKLAKELGLIWGQSGRR
jgi:hypothetical protein